MLSDEIKQFFHGDVAVDDATLTKYSRDYSLFKVRPQIVVFPKDVDDVKNLVKFVAAKKAAGEDVSLTGRSAGTDMTGGPLTQGIVVSFTKYFNHIIEIGANEAKVEPGVYFRDFEKELTARGLLYPPYPASKDLCALGGMVNNNSGGEKTLAYGKTEDFVEAVNIVMADGEQHTLWPLSGDALTSKLAEQSFEGDLFRTLKKLIDDNYDVIKAAKPDVSKNSAGYYLWNVWDRDTGVFDITKIIVGSQGTFGMLTEAKLRLVPLKKHSRLCVIFLKDLTPVAELVEAVLPFKPESIESYDDKTMEVAVKLWRQVIGSMKGNVISLGFQFLPEMWMVLRGGMPKMIMLVELTGNDENELNAELATLAAAVRKFAQTHKGIQVLPLKNEKQEQKYWTIRRESFALLHNNTTGKDTAPFIDDFIVKPEYMPEVLPKVNAILEKYKKDLIYTIAGHPGNGNFHIIPLMNLKDERVRALIPKISEEVYRLVFKYHGSITAEHNDGLIRTPYLEEMYGPKIEELFIEVKKIFDPLGIFNPGKKVGGSLKYSEEHIASTQ
ncbi:MAG TPA: FAD-binding oxidoreductase [Candidatus Paceibacterota bacterium]|nr:FAD-binding oxidoreductase [Candidatus Paceibacterota bacterium]